MNLPANASAKWSSKYIATVKAEVKSELEKVREEKGVKSRLSFLLKKINGFTLSEDAEHNIRHYVYAVSILVHQINFGGLRPHQIDNIRQVAYAILRAAQISPTGSQLSYLFGEIHIALGQIYLKDGDLWKATWEQKIAESFSRLQKDEAKTFNFLVLANRSLRLGFSDVTQKYINDAKLEAVNMSPEEREKISLLSIKTARLTGDFKRAKQEIEKAEIATDYAQLELRWEALSQEATEKGAIEPLIDAVKKSGSHFKPVYILEGYLWALSAKTTSFFDKFLKISTMARDKNLQFPAQGFFFRSCLTLEECLDNESDFNQRLISIGDVLSSRAQFRTIEHEMLFLAAVTRWLTRSNAFDKAVLVLYQYRSLSLNLSSGKNQDCLGILGDIFERAETWFKDKKSAE